MANVYRVLHRPCLPRVFAHAGTSASSPLLSGSTLAVLASAVEPRPLKRNVRGLALPQSVAVDSEAVAGPGSLETCKSIIMDPVADRKDRLKAVLQYAKLHADLADEDKTLANRVMGCTAQVWLTARLDQEGKVQFAVDSDSELTKGIGCLLGHCLSGQTPEQLQEASSGDFEFLEWGMGAGVASRVNPTANLLEAMKKRAAGLQGELPRFPSLLISADGLIPQGPFAEAQAQYLRPAPAQVAQLVQLLKEKKIGVVAHFYMDPEVQGVLAAAGEEWPHIHISDSLLMADSAVGMARAGCSAVLVLGVDFMSENVRAILDEAGHSDVQVYRMAEQDIGCSLAEAAEADTYFMYLGEAVRRGVPALHVVYINTSLRTKALAHSLVPTITCTSSNVVQTVLQAFAQIPDVEVYYGPDTYMGRNLAHLLTSLSSCSDAEVQEIHPQHTAASIRAALPRLHYYEEGTCIVHHMFGGEVTHLVRTAYGDAYLAAHFEVPGEMFALAMKARQERGMGWWAPPPTSWTSSLLKSQMQYSVLFRSTSR
eukprot:jgi/Botrbrau1/19822/Bobra.0124s0063.1